METLLWGIGLVVISYLIEWFLQPVGIVTQAIPGIAKIVGVIMIIVGGIQCFTPDKKDDLIHSKTQSTKGLMPRTVPSDESDEANESYDESDSEPQEFWWDCNICGTTGQCQLCVGTGRCGVCGGGGNLYKSGDFVDCSNCDGSGRCPSCEGSGICFACKGSGRCKLEE